MENAIKSIVFCIEALNGKTPEGGRRFARETLRKMYERPYKGRGLGIGSHRTGRISWEDRRIMYGGAHTDAPGAPAIRREAAEDDEPWSRLDWLHVLLCLFDGANLSEKEMFDYARQITRENGIYYNHILEHILENLAEQEAIDELKNYIPYFKTGNIYGDNGNDVIGQESMEYLGWRILLRYYARKADMDNFFKTFKRCNPGKDKYDMEGVKIDLVQSVMRARGIEAVMKLLEHKSIGERYTFNALCVLSGQGEYEKLKELFARYPKLKQPEKETELKSLASACETAAKQGLVLSDEEFNALFERAVKVNPKLKWGDMRLRDSVLFDLGLASKNNKERYIRCRKAIKNNWIKKELSDLA